MEEKKCNYDIQGMVDDLGVDICDIAELYRTFFIEMQDEINSLNTALQKNDYESLRQIVHNIKGVSSNLCICDVYDETAKFDIKLKQNITDNADIHIQNIIELIGSAKLEISEFFKQKNIIL